MISWNRSVRIPKRGRCGECPTSLVVDHGFEVLNDAAVEFDEFDLPGFQSDVEVAGRVVSAGVEESTCKAASLSNIAGTAQPGPRGSMRERGRRRQRGNAPRTGSCQLAETAGMPALSHAGVRHQRVAHFGRTVDAVVATPQALARVLEREAKREIRAVSVARRVVAEQRESVIALGVADVHPVQDDVVLDILPGTEEGIRQGAFAHVERCVFAIR